MSRDGLGETPRLSPHRGTAPTDFGNPQRLSSNAYKRKKLTASSLPETKLARDASLSPIRRSGSPVRRQQISAIEERARAGTRSVSPHRKTVSFDEPTAGAPTAPAAGHADIEARFAELEDRIDRKLQAFMDSVEKRLRALEAAAK